MDNLAEDRLVKYTEAARLLAVKPRTVRLWTTQHQIPHIKIGHTIRYKISDLLTWANDRRVS